jgi:hypothetical protein
MAGDVHLLILHANVFLASARTLLRETPKGTAAATEAIGVVRERSAEHLAELTATAGAVPDRLAQDYRQTVDILSTVVRPDDESVDAAGERIGRILDAANLPALAHD